MQGKFVPHNKGIEILQNVCKIQENGECFIQEIFNRLSTENNNKVRKGSAASNREIMCELVLTCFSWGN